MYKLEVIKNYGKPYVDGYDDTAWITFIERVTPLDVNNDIFGVIDRVLAPYSGINRKFTGHLEFPTKEDAIAFKLTWLV